MLVSLYFSINNMALFLGLRSSLKQHSGCSHSQAVEGAGKIFSQDFSRGDHEKVGMVLQFSIGLSICSSSQFSLRCWLGLPSGGLEHAWKMGIVTSGMHTVPLIHQSPMDNMLDFLLGLSCKC